MTCFINLDLNNTEQYKIMLESITAMGTLSAVLVAICLPYKQRKDSLKSNKQALKDELIYNLTQLFTGDVDRPLLFESFDIFRIQYADLVKNKENFIIINEIYSFLRFYNRIIESFYLIDPEKYGGLTTEKQVYSQNKILNIFNLTEDVKINDFKKSRDNYIKIFESNNIKIIKRVNKIIDNI